MLALLEIEREPRYISFGQFSSYIALNARVISDLFASQITDVKHITVDIVLLAHMVVEATEVRILIELTARHPANQARISQFLLRALMLVTQHRERVNHNTRYNIDHDYIYEHVEGRIE